MKDFAASSDAFVQAQLDRLAALSLPQGRIGLDVVKELLARLGNPQLDLPPVFHVAGTNGKGSTCAYLRAILEAQGLVVHTATKPHLVRYNERIRIAGKLIEDRLLGELLAEVLDISEDLGPSFFEVTTVATFLAFHRIPADACVIEVGLGGRLDATNVMDKPAVCAVNTLGVDHEAFLLNDEPGAPDPKANPMVRIAYEKAGIAREGVPLVTQAYAPDVAARVSLSAEEAGAPHAMRGRDWFANISDTGIAYRDYLGELALPLPTMPGAHQADNAALATAMIRHQSAVTVSEEAIAEGIRSAYWPARLQKLGAGPVTATHPERLFLLDGGHNPDAAEALATFLSQKVDQPIDAVVAMMAVKDARRFIQIVAPHLASLTAVPIPGSDHAPLDTLAELAREAGVAKVGTAESFMQALEALPATKEGTVLIFGSLYLAGKVLAENGDLPD